MGNRRLRFTPCAFVAAAGLVYLKACRQYSLFVLCEETVRGLGSMGRKEAEDATSPGAKLTSISSVIHPLVSQLLK